MPVAVMMDGVSEQVDTTRKPNHVARLLGVCVVIAVIVLCALAWRTGPLRTLSDPAHVSAQLDRFSAEPWAPLAMLGVFVVAELLFFPILVLISATALVFEPWRALLIALLGSLCATTVLFAIGKQGARKARGRVRIRALAPIAALLRGRDVFAVIVIRMLPIAPFTLTSVSLGALGVPLRVALLGTSLGMAPGIVAITAFGHQLRAVIAHPSLPGVALLLGLGGLWLAIALGMQKLAARGRKRERDERPG